MKEYAVNIGNEMYQSNSNHSMHGYIALYAS